MCVSRVGPPYPMAINGHHGRPWPRGADVLGACTHGRGPGDQNIDGVVIRCGVAPSVSVTPPRVGGDTTLLLGGVMTLV